jgi:hypothetical protein
VQKRKKPAEITKNKDKPQPISPLENMRDVVIIIKNKRWYFIPNESPLSFLSYLTPEIIDARPMQTNILTITLPITEPRETSACPFKTLAPETKKSGDAVPTAKMLAPIAKEEILRRLAIPIAPRIKTSPEAIISNKKTTIKIKYTIYNF